MFDPADFASWARGLPRGRSTETIDKRLQAIAFMRRELGLDVDLYLSDPDAAYQLADEVLVAYQDTHDSPDHKRTLAKALNWLSWYAARRRGGDSRFRGHHLELPAVTPAEKNRLGDEEVWAALHYTHRNEWLQGHRRALVWVGATSNLRRGEIHRMRRSRLDPDHSTAHVARPSKRGIPREALLPLGAWDPAGPLQHMLGMRNDDYDELWVTRTSSATWPRSDYSLANHDLRAVSLQVGTTVNFTSLRNWRSHLRKRIGLPLEMISFGLGESDIRSGRTYRGDLTWRDLSTAEARAGMPGYREYPETLPTWLEEVFAGPTATAQAAASPSSTT